MYDQELNGMPLGRNYTTDHSAAAVLHGDTAPLLARRGGAGLGIAVIGGLAAAAFATLAFSLGAGIWISLLIHFVLTPLFVLGIGMMLLQRPTRKLARQASTGRRAYR